MTTKREQVIEIFSRFSEGDGPGNTRKPVTQQEIDAAQEKCSVIFPDDLKDFWLNCGWGFLTVSKNNQTTGNFNFFMSPAFVAFALNRDIEHGFEEIEINEGYVPFFQFNEYSFCGMKNKASGDRGIYIYVEDGVTPEKVSDDIWDFILKTWEDVDWFVNID